MYSHVHFAAIAAWLMVAIVGLVWVMASAVTAARMEKEGIVFWKGFLLGLLLSPLTGLVMIFIARLFRPGRPLVQDVSRG